MFFLFQGVVINHLRNNAPHYIQPVTTGSQSPQPPAAHYQQSTWNSPLVQNWKQLLPANDSVVVVSNFRCGQGFFYSLYYSKSKAAQKALETRSCGWNSGLWSDFCDWVTNRVVCYLMLITVVVKFIFVSIWYHIIFPFAKHSCNA